MLVEAEVRKCVLFGRLNHFWTNTVEHTAWERVPAAGNKVGQGVRNVADVQKHRSDLKLQSKEEELKITSALLGSHMDQGMANTAATQSLDFVEP